ncbi:MAG: methyltransferase domain-containing protein [Planctomycetota bacterium]|nr:methyltransferase domain-containing protein [Planctomycetota bacterium]
MAVCKAAKLYDEYWRGRDARRTRARSESRARLALELLGGVPELLPTSGRSLRLIEVGCGPGWALEAFAAAGYAARGLEVSREAAETARARGLDVEEVDVEQSSPRGECDVLVLLEVLEHLVDPLGALRRLAGLLAPGGRVVASLPNEFHFIRRLGLLLGRAPVGGHDDPHLHYFDDRLSRRLFTAAKMRVLGRLSDSVVPPRYSFLRRLTAPATRLLPGLFALSNIYLLKPQGDRYRAEDASSRRRLR